MAQWPTSPAPTGMPQIGSIYPTLISTAQSLKRNVRTRGGQRWSIGLQYQNMTRAQWAVLFAFLLTLRGQYNTCTFVMPTGTYDTPLGTWPGSPLSNGINAAGSRTYNVKGFTAGQTGVAKAGDFFKGVDSKVYMVTADANSDGSGNAALAIEPALIVATADGDAITKTSVPFTVALSADQQMHSAKPPFLVDYSCTLVEAY